MADRVDTLLDPVEAANCQTVIYRVFSEPHGEQLIPSHHPMLSPRHLANLGIGTARPSQPAYFAG